MLPSPLACLPACLSSIPEAITGEALSRIPPLSGSHGSHARGHELPRERVRTAQSRRWAHAQTHARQAAQIAQGPPAVSYRGLQRSRKQSPVRAATAAAAAIQFVQVQAEAQSSHSSRQISEVEASVMQRVGLVEDYPDRPQNPPKPQTQKKAH